MEIIPTKSLPEKVVAAALITQENLIKSFMQSTYKHLIVVVIYNPGETSEKIKNLKNLDFLVKVEDYELISADLLTLVCETEDDAIELCKKIPNQTPYAQVWVNGEVVYENT